MNVSYNFHLFLVTFLSPPTHCRWGGALLTMAWSPTAKPWEPARGSHTRSARGVRAEQTLRVCCWLLLAWRKVGYFGCALEEALEDGLSMEPWWDRRRGEECGIMMCPSRYTPRPKHSDRKNSRPGPLLGVGRPVAFGLKLRSRRRWLPSGRSVDNRKRGRVVWRARYFGRLNEQGIFTYPSYAVHSGRIRDARFFGSRGKLTASKKNCKTQDSRKKNLVRVVGWFPRARLGRFLVFR